MFSADPRASRILGLDRGCLVWSLLDFRVGGLFGVFRCLCCWFAQGQCVSWRTLSVCIHVIVVGVVVHWFEVAGVGLLLGLFARVCLVLMIGVRVWCMQPGNSTRGH